MVLIDLLVENYLPKGVKVTGFMDSPFYIDIIPFNSSYGGFFNDEQVKFAVMNPHRAIPDDCAAFHAPHTWRCLMGQYRIPFVKTPFFMIASQFDKYQLTFNVGRVAPFPAATPGMVEYLEDFGRITRQLVQELSEVKMASTLDMEHARTKMGGFGFYSWACYNHDMSDTLAFSSMSINGTSQKDAWDAYYSLKPSDPSQRHFVVSWIEDCVGFACGTGCTFPSAKGKFSFENCSSDVYSSEEALYGMLPPPLIHPTHRTA